MLNSILTGVTHRSPVQSPEPKLERRPAAPVSAPVSPNAAVPPPVFEEHAFKRFSRDSAPSVPGVPDDLGSLRAAFGVRRRSFLKKCTLHLVETFKTLNPEFSYSTNLNPRRGLTKPSEPAGNDGYDNIEADLILNVNDELISESGTGQHYIVMDFLGKGTFGQVARCKHVESGESVAVKIIKNKKAYHQQAIIETCVLQLCNQRYDKDDNHHIVRCYECFHWRNHLCLVFEQLHVNLYELLKQNKFRGLSMTLMRVLVIQVLDALFVLSENEIIHCDLKPENVMLCNVTSSKLKLIDFGSACFEGQTIYTYIQSRFYRSPEVLLRLPYDKSIDMWSLGCIATELFLGLPMWPGTSEHNQLCRIIETLGQPPKEMLQQGRNTEKFFEKRFARDNGVEFILKSEEQYCRENNLEPQPNRKYFNYTKVPDLVEHYPLRKGLSEEDIIKEKDMRKAFAHFILGSMKLDPRERWTPHEALQHPFITGAPFDPDFEPIPRPERALQRSRPLDIRQPSLRHVQSAPGTDEDGSSSYESPVFPSFGMTPLGAPQHRAVADGASFPCVTLGVSPAQFSPTSLDSSAFGTSPMMNRFANMSVSDHSRNLTDCHASGFAGSFGGGSMAVGRGVFGTSPLGASPAAFPFGVAQESPSNATPGYLRLHHAQLQAQMHTRALQAQAQSQAPTQAAASQDPSSAQQGPINGSWPIPGAVSGVEWELWQHRQMQAQAQAQAQAQEWAAGGNAPDWNGGAPDWNGGAPDWTGGSGWDQQQAWMSGMGTYHGQMPMHSFSGGGFPEQAGPAWGGPASWGGAWDHWDHWGPQGVGRGGHLGPSGVGRSSAGNSGQFRPQNWGVPPPRGRAKFSPKRGMARGAGGPEGDSSSSYNSPKSGGGKGRGKSPNARHRAGSVGDRVAPLDNDGPGHRQRGLSFDDGRYRGALERFGAASGGADNSSGHAGHAGGGGGGSGGNGGGGGGSGGAASTPNGVACSVSAASNASTAFCTQATSLAPPGGSGGGPGVNTIIGMGEGRNLGVEGEWDPLFDDDVLGAPTTDSLNESPGHGETDDDDRGHHYPSSSSGTVLATSVPVAVPRRGNNGNNGSGNHGRGGGSWRGGWGRRRGGGHQTKDRTANGRESEWPT